MPANQIPIYVVAPRIGAVSIATANTNRDGTGTIGTVFTAGANGSRISRIRIKAIVTTTAGMIRLYIHDGSTYFLWMEILVTAITVSATVAAFENEQYLPGERSLVLPSGYSLRASTEKAETFKVIAEGGDY
jgi:hypothetical protein